MTTTPAGSPFWVRANDHTTYGGHTEKINHQGLGAINPRTDITAEEFCRLAADVAAMQMVAPFASITYLADDTTGPDDPTIISYDAAAGVAPTATRLADGVTQLDWPASEADDFGVSGTVDIQHADATPQGSNPASCTVVLSDPNADGFNERVTVYVWDDAGAAVQDARISVTISTGGN